MYGAPLLPRDEISLSNELQKVLHDIGKQSIRK